MKPTKQSIVTHLFAALCGLGTAQTAFMLTGESPKHYSVAAKHPGGALYECQGVRVKDGDTVECDVIQLPFGISLTNQSVRAADYDAWESGEHARSTGPHVTPEEITKGRKAAKDLRDLMVDSTLYIMPISKSRDNFGRLLAKFVVDHNGTRTEVGEWMRTHDNVRPTN